MSVALVTEWSAGRGWIVTVSIVTAMSVVPLDDGPAQSPFGELVRAYRTAAGLSQRALADRSGLSERAIRDLESGATARPRRHSVGAVATVLALTGEDLAAFLAAAKGLAASKAVAAVPLSEPGELIGRDEQLRTLADLVTGGRHRLITVTGPGGVGKSRLAAELAAALRRAGTVEVHVLDLSATAEPGVVGELIAETLGFGGASALSGVDRVASRLRGRRAVLVLDCFERVITAATDVAALVRRCPGLTVLTTSQRPLHVSGERLVRLRPLPLADAVELFMRRAAAARPGFALTSENADGVRAVCRAVEGLPLAVELAAARMRVLTPAELAGRLDRRLDVLTGGARDLPARHQSLRATIESSLEVVAEPARTLFTWLGAFPAGGLLGDLEAVAVALGHDQGWLLAALTDLVDTSLARAAEHAGATRYALPDAMRELAVERLAAGPDDHRVAGAVSAHYLGQLRRHADRARPGAHRDAGNVRAAVIWALTHDLALLDGTTVDAISRYYELTGRLAEGQGLLATVAAAGQPRGWMRAGQLARLRGRLDEAAEYAGRALTQLPADDHAGLGTAHLLLGSVSTDRREPGQSRSHLRSALTHARRAGDTVLVGRVLNNLGTLSMELRELGDAERLLTAALKAKRASGAGDVDCGRTLFNLAETALARGQTGLAAERALEAGTLLRAGGHDRLAAFAATTRALALLRLDQVAAAMSAAQQAIDLVGEAPDDQRTAGVIGARHSVVLHAAGQHAQAADALSRALPMALDSTLRDQEEAAEALNAHATLLAGRAPGIAAHLLGAAHRLCQHLPDPAVAATAAMIERTATACRTALGEPAFRATYRRGTLLDRADLLATCRRIAATP